MTVEDHDRQLAIQVDLTITLSDMVADKDIDPILPLLHITQLDDVGTHAELVSP